MGILNFFKNNLHLEKKQQSEVQNSKYENLPLIDPQEDKKAPKGYVERKFITEEHIYQQCDNPFFNSNIPIVNECEFATRYLGTMVLQNPNGKKVRSVTEIIYYTIPNSLQPNYLQLVSELNNLIMKHELPSKYFFPLDKIIFTASASDGNYKIPLSCIQYDTEKQELNFIFRNEVQKDKPSKYSTPSYECTKWGCITYTEDGCMKKADFSLQFKDQTAKIHFKNYKSGFDLYSIKFNGEIVYKRKTK